MNQLIETKSKLRMMKTKYKDLRNDYELLSQNIKANVIEKKAMRKDIEDLTKKYQELRAKEEGGVKEPMVFVEEALPLNLENIRKICKDDNDTQ